MRPWIVGDSSIVNVGESIGDGIESRITDSATGAGLFNPNTDPAVVGVDPLTGSLAASGTDMSFGAAIRRQMQTNVINGDFAVLPPSGVDSVVISDPADADYNPLPGWYWTPDPSGIVSLSMAADAGAASGYKATFTFTASLASTSAGQELYQFIAVPMSQGQQYRALLSAYVSTSASAAIQMYYQFYEADGVSAIGSEVAIGGGVGGQEQKGDAGLVPTTAAYLRLKIVPVTSAASTVSLFEVRCAFLPAEATVGLATRTSATGAITSTETQVLGITIPAGSFTVGSTYRFTAHALLTSSAANSVTFRMRVGPTTLTGSAAMARALTATTTASSDGFTVSGLFTVRTVGASGTCIGNVSIVGSGAQPFSTNAASSASNAAVSVDTTVANILEFTIQTGAGTTSVTVTQALWECVMAS